MKNKDVKSSWVCIPGRVRFNRESGVRLIIAWMTKVGDFLLAVVSIPLVSCKKLLSRCISRVSAGDQETLFLKFRVMVGRWLFICRAF